ncbi:NAD-dependent dihydropyrimidine dehydrogenase subunit PreT [Tetragenococcus halophilus]|uniref:FAD-dependent oxidoreductase n=1 Tax=Tetragenococcus halophilus TaxID=51669 RepID=UPI000B929B74|nr:FAD-dependent oxidoreductase [Tetragenococcus halophilus]MDN6640885.1 FAD-dependent oxidoreductase [Tetragenococcus sp.]MDN6144022.1 FAD-dependent oxidoreductase [Tetragenococcus halophilus]GEQ39056.1 glutamate synthase small subunit [Tetragenococcus halophilus]GEQ41300.1 glutamate synthase small subunit [Tetragenococcus halophilus]GEQ43560.1 glutamate synthase small subunit [Tetragenococcus halophilus]
MEYTKEEAGYTMTTVAEEAARCLLCHDAPCSRDCPADTDPGSFIRSVRFRNFKGAAETIRENNAMGAICARVCPTERYCELACSRTEIDVPIDIGGIQRFVTDFEQQADMDILKKAPANGKSIAIVGSGPAGLQAATTLLQKGYAVDIYEKKEKAGGYLSYGIPEYRLPTDIVEYEIKRIKNLGAQFFYKQVIGKDVTLDHLKENYDGVILAIGADSGKMLPLFENNPYAETAISFLAKARENKGQIDLPEKALVIGGGDVAMDVNVTLKLLGVEHVTDVVYEEFSEFKASQTELDLAQKHGATIVDGYVPESVDGNEVTFKARNMEGQLTIKADKIYLAVGQKVNADGLPLPLENEEVKFNGYQTDDSQVFVAGDIAKGDKTVVWAVQKGKEAARAVDQFLGGKDDDK